MMNATKHAVRIAAIVASVFGVSMLGGGAARAQIAMPGGCIQAPSGALCARAEVPNGALHYFAGAVVDDNGQVIGRDPDPDVQLNLLKDPEPMDQN